MSDNLYAGPDYDIRNRLEYALLNIPDQYVKLMADDLESSIVLAHMGELENFFKSVDLSLYDDPYSVSVLPLVEFAKGMLALAFVDMYDTFVVSPLEAYIDYAVSQLDMTDLAKLSVRLGLDSIAAKAVFLMQLMDFDTTPFDALRRSNLSERAEYLGILLSFDPPEDSDDGADEELAAQFDRIIIDEF